jgi:shikimate 5-dehydrogenase
MSTKLLKDFSQENPKLIVSDINLTKTWTTPLLDIAKNIWLPTLDWKGMVVYQWVDAIWTVFGDKIIQKWWTKEEVRQKLIDKILKAKKE